MPEPQNLRNLKGNHMCGPKPKENLRLGSSELTVGPKPSAKYPFP